MDKKLTLVQSELKAPKGNFNKFGNYKYRSCEDILEAVKPLLKAHDCSLTINDEIVLIGDRYYIKATATFNGDDVTTVSAFARESETKKGMDESQITGTASSYARKYALNGLFLIDDTKDADTDEYTNATKETKSTTASKPKWELTEARLDVIAGLVFETNTDLDKMLAYYKIGKLEELNEEQYNKVIAQLNAKKHKK